MDCRTIRELLDDYTLGSVSQKQRQALEKHVASCEDCRRELEAARRLHEVLKRDAELVSDEDWAGVEQRVLPNLRAKLRNTAPEGLLSRLFDWLRDSAKPQPRLAFAFTSTAVIVFAVVLGVFWLGSKEDQLAGDLSTFQLLWTSRDHSESLPDSGQIASLISGVELILADENGQDTYGTDADSVLEAMSEEVTFDEVDPDAIDTHISRFGDIWSTNGDLDSDVLDASKEEVESAVQVVFGLSENGS